MSMTETFMHRAHLYPLLLCFVLLPLGCEAGQAIASSHAGYGTATVYLDHYGVPHIYGSTDASVIYASAWVEANADWPLVERNFLRSIGRASEIFGEKTVGDDYLDRALQIPKLSREEYQHESPQMRRLLDAYAAGFNDWLAGRNKEYLSRFNGDDR